MKGWAAPDKFQEVRQYLYDSTAKIVFLLVAPAMSIIVQSHPGILWDKTMDYKLINIPNDNKQNYPFLRLKLLVKKFEH